MMVKMKMFDGLRNKKWTHARTAPGAGALATGQRWAMPVIW